MDFDQFVESLSRSPEHSGRVAHVERLAYREPSYGRLSHELTPALDRALESHGLLPLFTHQAEAIDAVLDGRDVVVATPAASGKSLCYNVPVAQALLTDRSTRALYLFPTKALAQDQLGGLRRLLPDQLASRVDIFDGDTPRSERSSMRRSAQVVLTNPDMLHYGILPNHRSWSRLLPSLRYVVVDEAHVYRGVFGSHVANVLRRLRRLCAHYGSDPVFVLVQRHARQRRRTGRAPHRPARAGHRQRPARPTARSTSSSGTRPLLTRNAGPAQARAASPRGCWRCC